MIAKRGLSGQVPAAGIQVILPDPVVVAAIERANGMAGMGCGNGVQQQISWNDAWGPNQTMGRDVNYQAVPLAGLGDIVPGVVNQRALEDPFNGMANNALVRSMAGLRGIGAFDTSSMSAFVASVQGGTSFGLPNLLLLVGGAALLFTLVQSGATGRRR